MKQAWERELDDFVADVRSGKGKRYDRISDLEDAKKEIRKLWKEIDEKDDRVDRLIQRITNMKLMLADYLYCPVCEVKHRVALRCDECL